jgi:hypothetical protein
MRRLVFASHILWYQLITRCLPQHYTPRLEQHSFIKTQNIQSLSWRYNLADCIKINIYVPLWKHFITAQWYWKQPQRRLRKRSGKKSKSLVKGIEITFTNSITKEMYSRTPWKSPVELQASAKRFQYDRFRQG